MGNKSGQVPQKSAKNAQPVKRTDTKTGSWKIFSLLSLITLITLFSFYPAFKNSFISWDDDRHVYENRNLSKPLPEAIVYYFEPHYILGNYIPLTMIVYTLTYHAAGAEPQFFHAVNIFIHVANVLLVFWLIYLISGKKRLTASIVALFFGIHPMHVESVAWVSELKDVLYGFFFIAGLIAYCKYLEAKDEKPDSINVEMEPASEQNKRNKYLLMVLTFCFFILSALSKPAAIIFPIVLLLFDFYYRRKSDKWMWIEKLPFFAVSIISGIIAIKAQVSENLIVDYYPFFQRPFFASYAFLNYIVKLILPVNITIFYPYPSLAGGHLPYLYYAAPVIVILLFYGVYRTLKYTRLVAFGFLFFFINIFLVLQFLSVGIAIMATRYTYIPYIGLFFIIAMYFDKLYSTEKPKLKPYRQAGIIAIISFAIICCYATQVRCEVWENDDTVYTDLLEKFPDDPVALNSKGYLLFEQKKYEESVALFAKAIMVKPDYTKAYINLINSYLGLKDYDNAVKITDSALKQAPLNYNLLTTKGYLLSMRQNYTEAIRLYKKSIELNRENTDGYVRLADAYFQMKDYISSVNTLDTGLKYNANDYVLLNNKGYSLFLMGKITEAMECFKSSLSINPDFTTAKVNLSNCFRAINDSSGKKK